MTGYPEVIPGQKSGSRTCQRLDVSETRFLGQPLYYRPGKYRYGSSRFVGRTAREAPRYEGSDRTNALANGVSLLRYHI
jgi:hypothetical protein